MDHYDITVIYARHDRKKAASPGLPRQTLPADKIQILPVLEEDMFCPRKKSLESIPLAEGHFTILLDEGDRFDGSFLERMKDGASSRETAFSMPVFSWQQKRRAQRALFALEGREDCSIDLRDTQIIFPLELHGLMIPTDALKEAYARLRFDVEPEKQMVLSLVEKKPRFVYLGTCLLEYAVAREYNSEYDMRCQTKEWYYGPLERYLLPLLREDWRKGAVSRLYQLIALYMLNIRLLANKNNENKHVMAKEEVMDYRKLYQDILQYIDIETILTAEKSCRPASLSASGMLFYLRLKKNDFSYYPEISAEEGQIRLMCDGAAFGGTERILLNLNLLDYEDGRLEIDGAYPDFFSDEEAQVFAKFDHERYALDFNQRYSMTKYFGVTSSRMKTFHVSVPVTDSKAERLLQFVLCFQEKEYVLDYTFPSNGSRFAKDFSCVYWRFGGYLAYWNKQGIHVARAGKGLVWKKEAGLWLQMWKKKKGAYRDMLPVKILNFLLRPYFSRQRIWLFLDKIYKGGDSAEYMYRYAAGQKDGIRKYYLLDKASADYARMRKAGYRPLIRGSLKHRLVFLNADLVIASNSTIFEVNGFGFERSYPVRGDVHFDVACVQHGMSVQKIAVAQQRIRDNTRLYFCASRYEIENLSKPVYDYAGYDALKLTGVPRYDGLKDRARKIIVLSPTWRMQSALPLFKNEGVARDYNPNFKETDYYKVYNSLINDPRLLDAARKHGYRIQYVLHPIVSPQYGDFTKNDLVEIIPSIGDMSYEKILCEGALMVTDFSGVQFDFAYMRKPVIYLHHNDIPQHYEEGTFFYETMGFGEICHTNDELIDVLCRYMEQDCRMPDKYRKRADDFFTFSDNRNCERIYPILLEYERRKRES